MQRIEKQDKMRKRIISGAKEIINFWDKSFKNDNGVVYVVQP